MSTPKETDLIYDWNSHAGPLGLTGRSVELDDETLRDGLQSPSVTDPPIERKFELLRLMSKLGINAANLGLPGAGDRARTDITRMAELIRDEKLGIFPNAACRTVLADITPLVEIVQKTGVAIEAACFIGSSPIRQYAEDWTLDHIQRLSTDAISYAVKNGLPVMYVTEDTTRSRPEDITQLYTAAIEAGARRICVCDTTGHANPYGARSIIAFVKELVVQLGVDVKVDWHGHSDRGLSVINAIAAIEAGADRVHATGLGIGERVGNTQMDTLLVNLQLDGYIDRDLSPLSDYTRTISDVCGVPVPHNYPVFGRDAFRTATGVHAAAIIKAKNKADDWLADRVYSGVPAGMVGLKQVIEIGFMSGASNIVYWLKEHEIEPEKPLVDAIFAAAKEHSRILTDEDIWEIVKRKQPQAAQ